MASSQKGWQNTYPISCLPQGIWEPKWSPKGPPFQVCVDTFPKTCKPCFLTPFMQFGQVQGVKWGPLRATVGRLVLRFLWGHHLAPLWGTLDPPKGPHKLGAVFRSWAQKWFGAVTCSIWLRLGHLPVDYAWFSLTRFT